jgi:hypothetical protein
VLTGNPPKNALQVCQASAAGGSTAYNINTDLEAGSHAVFITIDMSHSLLATLKHEQLINHWTFGIN